MKQLLAPHMTVDGKKITRHNDDVWYHMVVCLSVRCAKTHYLLQTHWKATLTTTACALLFVVTF